MVQTDVHKSGPDDREQHRIQDVEFIRHPQYQTHHADGFLVEVTPSGQLLIASFHQHGAFPQRIAYAVDEQGILGEAVQEQWGDALVREFEVGLVCTEGVARDLIRMLEAQLARLQADIEVTKP